MHTHPRRVPYSLALKGRRRNRRCPYLTQVPHPNPAQSASKIQVFYPPRFAKWINFSCAHLAPALDHFTKLVGASYPFDDFKLVFSDTLQHCLTSPSMAVVGTNFLVYEGVVDGVYESRYLLLTTGMWFLKIGT
jgi:hypothetical protein